MFLQITTLSLALCTLYVISYSEDNFLGSWPVSIVRRNKQKPAQLDLLHRYNLNHWTTDSLRNFSILRICWTSEAFFAIGNAFSPEKAT